MDCTFNEEQEIENLRVFESLEFVRRQESGNLNARLIESLQIDLLCLEGGKDLRSNLTRDVNLCKRTHMKVFKLCKRTQMESFSMLAHISALFTQIGAQHI